ncbi:MAG TPA: MerR family transcriptional regulator, partial [Thermoanaerobaculia bacterium]|nr:MerR family transcriptional regulator [Thermoanaerobaculia bacterium]
KAGQRVYSEEELQLILRIKQLLYEEGYTIAGAKKKLDAELASGGLPPLPDDGGGEDDEPDEAAEEAPAVVAAASPPQPATAAPARLDTAAAQQVEKLRTGVQKALTQAREILQLLP